VILLVAFFVLLIRGIFFKSEYIIQKVKFSEQTIANLEDIELFNAIAKKVKNQNYYMLKNFNKREILDTIKISYPFVKEIQIQMETGNVLGIHLNYTEPLLRIKLGEKYFGVRGKQLIFPLQSGSNLGQDTFIVDTPQYLSGVATLDGFFFQISLQNFLYLIPIVQKEFPNMNRFVYLAGSTRLVIFTNGEKTIYLNLQDPEKLDEQLNKYHMLQNYYKDFDKIAVIDLGSLDETKVTIRKKK
jgi:hypothetical protein